MVKIAAAGISWFKREDYPRVLKIMQDAHVLPATFDEWIRKAEGQEARAKAQGLVVIRVVINPEKFVAWCTREGLKVDAKARTAFAADGARRKIMN